MTPELAALRARYAETAKWARAQGKGWKNYALALERVVADLDALSQPLSASVAGETGADTLRSGPSELAATDEMVAAAAKVLKAPRPLTGMMTVRRALEAALAART